MTTALIILTIFLLIALGVLGGWLLNEVWTTYQSNVDFDFDLNNVGNEETGARK